MGDAAMKKLYYFDGDCGFKKRAFANEADAIKYAKMLKADICYIEDDKGQMATIWKD